jgi:hypothetical protein
MRRVPGYRPLDLRKLFPCFNQADLLGMAWLAEQAACWREHVGDDRWAKQLFSEASALRDAAVNR